MTAKATILTVGDELMLGDRVDTNGPWLSAELLTYGIKTIERRTVHDNVMMISSAIKSLSNVCDLLLVTGGLGPTNDDRTRRAMSNVMGKDLVIDDAARASIVAWFDQQDAVMPQVNEVQAMVPETASWIPNANGTAPGLCATIEDCIVVCLPGPPAELQPMFKSMQKEIFSTLDLGGEQITDEIHSWGMAESVAGERIEEFMQLDDPRVAILTGSGGITARVTSSDQLPRESIVQKITDRWSPWVYGNSGKSLAESMGELISLRGGTLATAESCTGGMLSELVVRVVGASDWFKGGLVAYSNDMKVSQLGVEKNLIDAHGAVSAEVVSAMCQGAIEFTGATCALSTSGIAGPTGGSTEKPVGTVYIASCVEGVTQVRLFRFSGSRDAVIRRAACSAMQMLRLQLCGNSATEMHWQQGASIQC